MRPGPAMSDLNRYLVPALYEGGWSLREIGDCLGVSYQAIQQTLIKLGISLRPQGSGRRQNGKARVRREWVRWARELSPFAGPRLVRRVFSLHYTDKLPAIREEWRTPTMPEQIRALWNAGASEKSIGAALGISPAYVGPVLARLRHRGVPVRYHRAGWSKRVLAASPGDAQ